MTTPPLPTWFEEIEKRHADFARVLANIDSGGAEPPEIPSHDDRATLLREYKKLWEELADDHERRLHALVAGPETMATTGFSKGTIQSDAAKWAAELRAIMREMQAPLAPELVHEHFTAISQITEEDKEEFRKAVENATPLDLKTLDNRQRRVIRWPAVQEKTNKSRPQTWRDVRAGTFPAPVRIGPNSIGWFEDEIDAWLASRPRVRYAPRRKPNVASIRAPSRQ